MSAEISPARWADAIAARVGTYGNGLWLPTLGKWLGFTGTAWLPNPPEENQRVIVPAPIRALQLELYALPSYEQAVRRTRLHHIVLDRAAFNAEMAEQRPLEAALPFGLDAAQETPESAGVKLGGQTPLYRGKGDDADTASWELDDNRVVELVFRTQATGIKRIQIVRLWRPVQSAG